MLRGSRRGRDEYTTFREAIGNCRECWSSLLYAASIATQFKSSESWANDHSRRNRLKLSSKFTTEIRRRLPERVAAGSFLAARQEGVELSFMGLSW